VCAEPDSDRYQRVIVSVTTDKPYLKDRACALTPADHDFIKHDSLVLYQKSALVTSGEMNRWLSRGEIQTKRPCADSVITRIRAGALASPFTPQQVKDAIRDCSWKPR
jgi:hypothetical protein